jgi:uncharacterized protein (DUF1697 family)
MRNTELRAVFGRLGLDAVSTVLSSGNVLFETPEPRGATLETAIERAMQEHLGAPCATFVRSRERMVRLATFGVFDGMADEGSRRCMVTFLRTTHDAGLALPHAYEDSTALALHDHALFSVVDTTDGPAFMRWMEGEFGAANTTRSWRTVRRVVTSLDR